LSESCISVPDAVFDRCVSMSDASLDGKVDF
jgi:hypothetical protein